MAEARQYPAASTAGSAAGTGATDPRRAAPAPPKKPPRLSGRDAHSVFVSLLKLLLPAVAVGLILLVVVWPQVQQDDSRFRVGVSKLAPEQAENLNMINARFEGVDDQDRPFTVTADVATQRQGQPNLIELQLPKADMTMKDGAWVALTARQGLYRRDSKVLELSGEVSLFHDRGFELRTSAARIDLEAGVASGDRPVQGHGPSGRLEAEGFRMGQNGERILFTGNSRMVLYGGGAGTP
jgi:lipopolysaccharide export system protein LptC